MLLTTVIAEFIHIIHFVKPKATCHITQKASINARTSVQYPI